MFEKPSRDNIPEYSVSEISLSIKNTVEDKFSYVKIRGEISGFKRAPSGHIYLNLKDEKSILAAVCWKGIAETFPFEPEEGLEVVCTGKVTTYSGQSKYQLVIEYMEPAGVGALMALLEKRKSQFEKEGLFAKEHKKKIPFLPDVIGIVTSPTGAVIEDMLHRIAERFPRRIMLWPVLVQGDKASVQVTKAIKGFNKFDPEDSDFPRPDLIIVARGGGSLEDLWAFNEENVVRAVYNSNIPVISAIGHETDTTLIDYVADLRAPTPTAAAEFAVPVKEELALVVNDFDSRLKKVLYRFLAEKSEYLKALSRGLPNYNDILSERIQRLDGINIRLVNSLRKLIEIKRHNFNAKSALLKSPISLIELGAIKLDLAFKNLQRSIKTKVTEKESKLLLTSKMLDLSDHKKLLSKGFVLVRDNKTRQIIKSADGLPLKTIVQLEFSDGVRDVFTLEGNKTRQKKQIKQDDRQKILL